MHIIKFLVIMSSAFPHYLVSLLSTLFLNTLSLYRFLPHCERPSSTPTQNNRENYSSVYLNLYIVGQQTGTQNILH
jgi:hypothetical protein